MRCLWRRVVQCTIAAQVALTGAVGFAAGHELAVTVTQVKENRGAIVISLFAKTDGFPDDSTKAAYTATVTPQQPVHVFTNLPAGSYAVAVFHDKNQDGKLDKSFIGFPQEPIGLSNHPVLGPPGGRPNFAKAKLEVPANNKVEVNLIELGR